MIASCRIESENFGQCLFSNGAATGSNGISRTEGGKVAAAVTPKPPHKALPQVSTKLGEIAFVAWNPGTTGTSARIPPAPEQTSGGGAQGQNNGSETVCRLAKCLLGTNDYSCNEEGSEDIGDKWIADSGESLHTADSADHLSDV